MEYIEGGKLSSVWKSYTEGEKKIMMNKLARILVDQFFMRFEKIGGILPDGEQGPTVGYSKIVNGRVWYLFL